MWADYNATWMDWCAFLDHRSLNFQSISGHLEFFYVIPLFLFPYFEDIGQGFNFSLNYLVFHPVWVFFLVKQALKGYWKTNFKPDSCVPISVDLLEKICSSTLVFLFLIMNHYCFISLCVCFFGAFHVSELLPCSKIDTKWNLFFGFISAWWFYANPN